MTAEPNVRTLAEAAAVLAEPEAEAWPAPEPAKTWFLAYIRNQRERGLEEDLADLGFDRYFPRETVHGQMRGRPPRRVTISRALFPGYMFVAVDYPRQSFRTVSELFGVIGFIGNARPMAMPAGMVEALIRAEAEGVFVVGEETPREVQKDDVVKIGATAWIGFIGKVVRAKSGEEKVKVLVEAYGNHRVVEVDRAYLEVVA